MGHEEVDLGARAVHHRCTMPTRPIRNPIRRYKKRLAREWGRPVTYGELAGILGLKEDFARKLGAETVTSISHRLAVQLEERSDGAIRYLDVMRWIRDRMSSGKRPVAGRR